MKRSYAQPFQRENPSGQMVWVAPVTDPRTKKRGRAGTHKTKREARAAQDAYYKKIQAGVGDTTVAQYVDYYLTNQMHDKQANTVKGLTCRLNRYVVPTLGDLPISEVRRRHVEDLMNGLIDQGLAAQSIRNVLACASAMFSSAVRRDETEINPWSHVGVSANDKRIKAQPREHMILSYSEMLKVAMCAPKEMRGAVLFPGATGARPSEVLSRVQSDVDRKTGLVRIDTTADRGQILPGTKTDHGKPNPGRWAIVTPELLELLPPHFGLLFPTPTGKIWWLDNFRNRIFAPAAEKAGFKGLIPYDLRHSHVSLMRAAGVDPADLAEKTGHSVEMQSRVYTHALGRSDEQMKAVLSA